MRKPTVQLNGDHLDLINRIVQDILDDTETLGVARTEGSVRKVWKLNNPLMAELRRFPHKEKTAIMRAVEAGLHLRSSLFEFNMNTVLYRTGVTVRLKS